MTMMEMVLDILLRIAIGIMLVGLGVALVFFVQWMRSRPRN